MSAIRYVRLQGRRSTPKVTLPMHQKATAVKPWSFTFEYQGKIYHFYCLMCVPEFKKNPEKYIEIIDKEKAQ
jgi:YHS domain-containing protein